MTKKAAYYLLSTLIVLSATFAVAPMAFCTLKTAAPKHSCCKPPVEPADKSQCPICANGLCQQDPASATASVKSYSFSEQIVSHLPSISAPVSSYDLIIADYSVIPNNDSSPPLYLQFCNFRI